MFYSQAGQDLWVLNKIGGKGFFVDVGAYDGIESSNTWALEKIGWKGVCIEPNKDAYYRLVKNRICHFINSYANNNPGETLTDHLLFYPHPIDYLSIDVDGEEMDVLKGMDFKAHYVKLITIEHNQYLEGSARQDEIYDYLVRQGFERAVKDVKCLDVNHPEYFGKIYEDWYENTLYNQ